MALNPEDVIKKSFSATHLRRGYDETQVDDFLDEVVVELRRLLAENDSLRTDLEDCRASRGIGDGEVDRSAPATAGGGMESDVPEERSAELVAELEQARRELLECQEARARAEERLLAAEAPRAEGEEGGSAELQDWRARVEASDRRVQELEGQLAEAQDRARAAEEQAQQAHVEAEQARREVDERAAAEQGEGGSLAAAAAAMPATAPGEEASKLISLAQRLHDQHVDEGVTTKRQLVEEAESYRDRTVAEADERSTELVTTGQETHDRLVQEGRTKHDELVTTGQETHDRLVSEGQQQREQLVTEGQTSHDQMVSKAEQQRTTVLDDLSKRQAALTARIGALQKQEHDLRDRLRTFLADQLSRVEGDPKS